MRSSSKLPVLSGAGQRWLTLALLLTILGAGLGNPLLAALGVVTLAALLCLYLLFFPTAILLWRRYLELIWWLPRSEGDGASAGLVARRPFPLKIALRNLAPLPLGVASLRIFASRCVRPAGTPPRLSLPARSEVQGELSLQAMQAGAWFLHGAAVRIQDPLGLFAVEAYFPSTTPLRVLPRHEGRGALPALRIAAGASDERLGSHSLRHRGQGGELRELRDYVPGDPFKLIAWKASARAPLGRLLVRELDRETLLLHTLILDCGSSMREGPPGGWKLDHALSLALSYGRATLDGGDRLALCAFDHGMLAPLRPGEGPAQRLRLVERLLSLMNVVDERLTAVSDGELCAAVARYLRQQEGVDVRTRRPRPLDDAAAWAQVIVSPTGEVYSLRLLVGAARRILDRDAERDPRAARVPLPDNDLAVLRAFCQRRGIELPYGRGAAAVQTRVEGLAEALRFAAAEGGAQRVVLLSDLAGIVGGDGQPGELAPVAQAAALCRRRGFELLCLLPRTQRYLPSELRDAPRARRAAEIFGWEVTRREDLAHQAMVRLGFHVIGMGPEDNLGRLLMRVGPTSRGSATDRQRTPDFT